MRVAGIEWAIMVKHYQWSASAVAITGARLTACAVNARYIQLVNHVQFLVRFGGLAPGSLRFTVFALLSSSLLFRIHV